jgi:peptidoglycan lytic transglycosylase
MRLRRLVVLMPFLLACGAATADETPESAATSPQGEPVVEQHGDASYYSDKFQGQTTATGERFSQHKMTAASPSLPLGTRVTVTNEANGKSVDVKVNDRGPYVDGRVIDLSKKAAEKLDMKEEGVAPVKVEARPSSQPTEELKQKVKQKAAAQPDAPQQEAAE